MRESKIKIGLLFLILSFSGCSTQLTIEKINTIIENQHKIESEKGMVRNKETYEVNPELKNVIVENREHEFNKNKLLRNKVVDTLKMLSYKKSMIIERTKDLNGMMFTVQYFFFNDKIFSASYNTQTISKNGKQVINKEVPIIEQTSVNNLRDNYQNDILEIYNHFNQNTFSNIKDSFTCTPSFGSYKITLIIDNKMGYYGIIAKENCRVFKYY